MTCYPRLPDPAGMAVNRIAWRGLPSVFIVRGDLIHPVVSGNKWFKLKPLLEQCQSDGIKTLVSVGGAYSNHLHALAFAGERMGFNTVGLVRGPEPERWSPTLVDCHNWGMDIRFLSRVDYNQRHAEAFARHWCARFAHSSFVPEGGWSELAINGSGAWWNVAGYDLDAIVCPVGSGTTLAGLARAAPSGTRVIGVPVYRDPNGYAQLRDKLSQQGIGPDDYRLWSGWAGRGFGRLTASERRFIDDFEIGQGIQLDPVYTVKTFRAVADCWLTEADFRDMKVGVLHTGGLQGRRPLNAGV